MKVQLSLLVGELGSQSVELFGRSEAFVSGHDYQLFLLNHVHEFDPNECVLSCLERLEPQHRPGYPLDSSMILLHDIVEIFHLTDGDGRTVFLVIAFDGSFIGITAS